MSSFDVVMSEVEFCRELPCSRSALNACIMINCGRTWHLI